ncbi:major histocompatibility complex class I-related gene protein-like isoform X3 [Anabas testudineus]|uniref:major histocompatibility complex class I-related gene protein-like isoform X3 n=1 Tax=Anabas testudineus TaxID=64144 RepID=UPI000E45FD1A|nr:major histocompatibility complex class I-related gene protein-like isoform X3 [Anabas testudineus]
MCGNLIPGGFRAIHSLMFLSTGLFEDQTFPEFVRVALVDGVEVIYCDSEIRRAEPKQDWMKDLMEADPQHTDWYFNECLTNHSLFNSTDFMQTEGVHIFQERTGCEWDDETHRANGVLQFGLNGEDIAQFDFRTQTWSGANQQSVLMKRKLEDSVRSFEVWNHFTQDCTESLKKYLTYRRSFLLRTDLPSVSLLQKTPSSPVSCHATGFYTDIVNMFWRKDGEEIHEDVDHGEILPNHDGSFQMRVDLNISSIKPEDWSRYDCVFQFSDVKKDIITKLDKAEIRTNWESLDEVEARSIWGEDEVSNLRSIRMILKIAGCVISLFALICGCCMTNQDNGEERIDGLIHTTQCFSVNNTIVSHYRALIFRTTSDQFIMTCSYILITDT